MELTQTKVNVIAHLEGLASCTVFCLIPYQNNPQMLSIQIAQRGFSGLSLVCAVNPVSGTIGPSGTLMLHSHQTHLGRLNCLVSN